MTYGLAMIVRQAEESLPRLLAGVGDVCDPQASTIIDTGSTDNTLDVIRDWGAEPLTSEWRNFQHNRSELMRESRGKADRLMLLDDDLEIEWKQPLKQVAADIGRVKIRQSTIDFRLPVIVHGDKPWEYRGYAHSYLYINQPVSHEDVDAFVLHDRGKVTDEKIARDVELLKAELADHPGDERAMFYLAQSYRDLHQWEDSIACYRRRAEMAGYDEERWFAVYQAGVLLCEHRSFAEGAELLLAAYRMRPHRAEPLRALANASRSVANKIPYPENDRLFVHHQHYVREH